MRNLHLVIFALAFIPQGPAFSDGDLCATGLAAYQATLFPFQRQHCATCHGDGGIALGHSVADPKAAYAVTKDLIDFSDIEGSTLMTMFKEKHWLQYGGPPIAVEPDAVEVLIQSWWTQGEQSCPQATALVSAPIAIPSDLPTRESGNYLALEWNLGTIDSKFSNCKFQIDIQKFTTGKPNIPGSYRVRNPRAGCVGAKLHVSGFRLPINGRSQGYENYYDNVEQIIPSVSDGSALVSLSSDEGILTERLPAADAISVKFGGLEITP